MEPRALRVACAVAAVLLAAAHPRALAQSANIASAPPGLSEAGSPPFSIVGTEALGLESPPTDMHLMPDGRLLVLAPHQIVLGDGARWQMYRQKPRVFAGPGTCVAVDADSRIYVAVRGGFSRVRLNENSLWDVVPVSGPVRLGNDAPVPRVVLEVGPDWIWHSGSGAMVSWRPGRDPAVIGHGEDVAHVFELGGTTYFSERNSGSLYRLSGGNASLVPPSDIVTPNDTILCSAPFAEGQLLVGTQGRGVFLFDGSTLRPFLTNGPASGGTRVSDLCAAGDGSFAAAIENLGVVFFDRKGRVLQSLGVSVDSRLARVQKLITAPGGVVWGLLENAVLRVEFPSRISSYDALIGHPVVSGHPYRYNGRLWVQNDGRSYVGVYDSQGRLDQLRQDEPSEDFVFSLSFDMGIPVASTANNAYFKGPRGWEAFAPGTSNLRILEPNPRGGRWLYGAKGEIGWLRRTRDGVEIERIRVPGLMGVYNSATDADGSVWIELGTGKVGRVRVAGDRPTVEIFGPESGVPEGWAQVYALGGRVGFNIADKILRFDAPTRRFVEDEGFAAALPQVQEVVGRPGIDSAGRLWMSANGGVLVFERKAGQWHAVDEPLPAGIKALYFTFEADGVVWLNSDRLLLRYDPSVRLVDRVPLKALITQVTLASSNRTIFDVKGELPALDHEDNSLIAYFAAPGNHSTLPVTFEVMLEGSNTDWVPVGSAGSAVFNRLKEGRYVLHVRPEAGRKKGEEAVLAFSVLAPWYRSHAAYASYALALILSVWAAVRLQRRKSAGLERLVAQRTKELNESNARLAAQVEDIRMLSQVVEQSPVSILITHPDGRIVFANPHLCQVTGYELSELEGADSAILRSEMVSPELITEINAIVRGGASWHGQLANRMKDGGVYHVRTTIAPIRGPDGTIPLHIMLEEDITEWLADQERRKRLEDQLFQSQKLESLGTLAGGIAHDFNNILTGIIGYCELARLGAGENPELLSDLQRIHAAGLRARDLVSQILTFSRRSTVKLAPIDIAAPVSEAMKLVQASTPSTVQILTRLEPGVVRADSTQIQQVVLNLCTNSVHAMRDRAGRLEVSTTQVTVDDALRLEVPELVGGRWIRITVSDNGHGMEEATLQRIFDPFFTTKKPGEGTGLGLAIVQGIMAGHNGFIRVRSTRDVGTTFDLYFPLSEETVTGSASPFSVRRGEGEEILLVDDEPSVVDFAAKRLRLFGYSVSAFHDSREALAAFEASGSRFKALVTDLTMPHLTGIDLARKVRASGSMIPIVIMTGYGRTIVGGGADAIPRCVVVNKPFVGDDLARALNQLFGS